MVNGTNKKSVLPNSELSYLKHHLVVIDDTLQTNRENDVKSEIPIETSMGFALDSKLI